MLRTLAASGFVVLASSAALGQPPAEPPQNLEFDAASVKLVTFPKDGKFAIGSRYDPGQYVAEYVTMRDLIAEAYSLGSINKLTGPDWINADSVRYSINAKSPGPVPYKQVRVMLQHLLASRFQLKLHTVERAAPRVGRAAFETLVLDQLF